MNKSKKKVICVVGTRPEAIKMAPVIQAFKKRSAEVDCHMLLTAQHRELLDQALKVFDIQADTDLDVMTQKQTITDVTCRVLREMADHLARLRPDVVLAQGDTTTVMATAMACFYADIPFGHIEAGLRTYDLHAPYPEEYNRRVTAVSATYHFTPTQLSRDNLFREGVASSSVYVTGNTVVDALRYILEHTEEKETQLKVNAPYLLMTCHRRESFGEPIRNIFKAVAEFAHQHPEFTVWYPVHPNPNVYAPAHEILSSIDNVLLDVPMDYISFVHAMAACTFLLTDSGGIQEEAVSLGKPTLVLRDITERPEAISSGICQLVGTDYERILDHLQQLVDSHGNVTTTGNPFGDGHAGENIVEILCADLNI